MDRRVFRLCASGFPICPGTATAQAQQKVCPQLVCKRIVYPTFSICHGFRKTLRRFFVSTVALGLAESQLIHEFLQSERGVQARWRN